MFNNDKNNFLLTATSLTLFNFNKFVEAVVKPKDLVKQ